MSDPARPAKRRKYDFNATFDVAVGSELFTLHTHVFTERSEFFRAARKPEWIARVAGRPVDLKTEDSTIFNDYVNCVYTGNQSLQQYADEASACPRSEQREIVWPAFKALIRIYILADKLQDPTTANMVVDEIIRYSSLVNTTPTRYLAFVYAHTTPSSPLRKLLLDYWIHVLDHTRAAIQVTELPREFLEDLATEFVRIQTKDATLSVRGAFKRSIRKQVGDDACRYHQHDDFHTPNVSLDRALPLHLTRSKCSRICFA